MNHTPQRRGRRHQSGVVMLFGLIALAIMLIGAVAIMRSMNTSLSNAGNLGFKRDLTNQAERAMAPVIDKLRTGSLSAVATRQAHVPAENYRATLLPTNAQGLPNALLSDANFTAAGMTGADISVPAQGVTLRYVIDRMCVNTGVADATHCTMVDVTLPGGCGVNLCDTLDDALPQQPAYRVSVRVTGPRNTQAFFQTTVAQ